MSARHVSKVFGGTRALSDVDILLAPGRIHGLIGENGAGKSTLVKILSGVHRPDTGRIELGGRDVEGWSPQAAIDAGLVTVHQDVNLIETMTVTENVFLNSELTRYGMMDRTTMRAETGALLSQLDLAVSPDDVLGSFPTDVRKMIQLARAMRQKPRVLLLDEPTSSLTASEVNILTRQVRAIANTGVAVLYISHYLSEVFTHCDNLTVLRDGIVAWDGPTSDTDISSAIRAMIGTSLRTPSPKLTEVAPTAEPILDVRGLSLGHRLTDVSFSVRPGEILAIGGLVGAGLGDLSRALFADPDYRPTSGEIIFDGAPVSWKTPADAMKAGVALVTNDRHRTGALLDFSIADNISLPSIDRLANRFGLLPANRLRSEIGRQMERLTVKSAGPDAALVTLSGGNQQKVMLAKWFMTEPRLLVLDEPTIGVDIGAKQSIRDLIKAKAEEGCAVIVLSSEMEELAEVADRAIVLFRGRVVARLDTPGFTHSDLTDAANAADLAPSNVSKTSDTQ